jgi:hypothetical protein
MRFRFVLPFPSALVLLLLAGSLTRADFVNWSYNWTHSPIVVAADTGGTGGVTLTNHQGGAGSGNSDIVATQITTFSSASVNTPDRFTGKNYSLLLDLTDLASHQSSMLTFSGTLNGTLSATSANIRNTFIGPLTQHVDLGGNFYTITIGPYAAPGIPDATQTGSISAHVSAIAPPPDAGPGSGPPPSHDSPEPATLLLAGLGSSVLALAAGWRQRLRAKRSTIDLAN